MSEAQPKPTLATLNERVSALEEQGPAEPVQTDPMLDEHKAFLAWQKRMPNIAKARAGHKYKYVGLSELLSAVLPVLTELGFSLYHETDCGPDGQTLRVTCFLRFGPTTARTSSLSIPMDQVVRAGQGMNVVQAMGSFITYARRYTTMCVLGITDGVDTDAADLSAPANGPTTDTPAGAGPHDELVADLCRQIEAEETVDAARERYQKAMTSMLSVCKDLDWSTKYKAQLQAAGQRTKTRIEGGW